MNACRASSKCCILALQTLDPGEHVEVAGRVLLDDVLHVVRPQSLLELAPRHKELDLAQASDDSLVHDRQ